jgi:similar to stage IV sporulation protein
VRNQVFYAEIYRRDLNRIKEIATECGIDISHYEYETISKKIIRYKNRIGILSGLILVAAAIWYFSHIVMVIEIQGNSYVREDVILSALEELDIKQGTFIDDIDFSYCENELRIMVDGISWAGIRHTGNRVVVQITEIVEAPEMLRERISCNVVADKAAQITSTSVYEGQLMRIVGDYVMPGDMLISGITEDAHGNITKHHASGLIKGIYEETAVFTENYTSEEYVETNNSISENYLKLFNLKIPLFIGKNNFASSNISENEQYLELFGKKLPIGIIKKKITETQYDEINYSDEEIEEKIMERIYLYEMNFLSDEKILERKISSEKNEDGIVYTVNYTVEGEIGEQSDVFIK